MKLLVTGTDGYIGVLLADISEHVQNLKKCRNHIRVKLMACFLPDVVQYGIFIPGILIAAPG